MTNEIQPLVAEVRRKAVIYGVIMGVLAFVLGIISLIIMKNGTGLFTVTFISIFVNYGILIGLACYFSILLRKAIGGYWDFSTALKNIFIMLAISGVLATVGTSVMNASYPRLQEEAIDNMMNMTIESLEAMGAPDEQIDSTVEELEMQKDMLGTLSIGQVIKGIAVSLILYFVFALILAAIFKREKPMFIQPKGDEAHPWQNGSGDINSGN